MEALEVVPEVLGVAAATPVLLLAASSSSAGRSNRVKHRTSLYIGTPFKDVIADLTCWSEYKISVSRSGSEKTGVKMKCSERWMDGWMIFSHVLKKYKFSCTLTLL